MAKKKLPWMKFYVNDHRAEPRLQLCSMAARGLWLEMLCLMFVGQPHRYLAQDGRPISAADLARFTGQKVRDVTVWLEELKTNKVFSTSKKGIYSRRILRDAKKREEDRINGLKGGNPLLIGIDDNRDNLGVNPKVKAQSPEARVQKSNVTDQKLESQPRVTVSVPVTVPAPSNVDELATEVLKLVQADIPVAEANLIIVAEYTARWRGLGFDQTTIISSIRSVLARPRDGTKQFSLAYFEKVIVGTRAQIARISGRRR